MTQEIYPGSHKAATSSSSDFMWDCPLSYLAIRSLWV